MKNQITKPIKRGRLRQLLGKEFYIYKRKADWLWGDKKWAKTKSNTFEGFPVFNHRSMVLRPLKDVDMYLQENKRTNLKLAIAHLDKIIIRPNEIFSIWKLVGRPSKWKGYLDGLVLKQGKIAVGTGGGLCQLGNLLFWIFVHSPLTVTERYRHGFDVFPGVNRKVPFGAGATLSYNYIDLQVTNTSKKDFQINLWLDETHLNGALFCSEQLEETYRIEERNHLMKRQVWGGYSRHNQIVKIVQHADKITEELLVENHAIMMYDPFLEPAKSK